MPVGALQRQRGDGTGSVLRVSRQGSWMDCKGGGLGREWRITLRFWLSGWEEGGAVYRDGDPRGRRNGVSGTGQTSSRFAHITTRPVARGLAVCGP